MAASTVVESAAGAGLGRVICRLAGFRDTVTPGVVIYLSPSNLMKGLIKSDHIRNTALAIIEVRAFNI